MLNRLAWRVPGQRAHEAGSVHPDTAVNPPGLHVESQRRECALPRMNVQIVGVDKGASISNNTAGGDMVDPDIGDVGDVLIGVEFPAGRSETTLPDPPSGRRLAPTRPGKQASGV